MAETMHDPLRQVQQQSYPGAMQQNSFQSFLEFKDFDAAELLRESFMDYGKSRPSGGFNPF
jgi:hypothetical protein